MQEGVPLPSGCGRKIYQRGEKSPGFSCLVEKTGCVSGHFAPCMSSPQPWPRASRSPQIGLLSSMVTVSAGESHSKPHAPFGDKAEPNRGTSSLELAMLPSLRGPTHCYIDCPKMNLLAKCKSDMGGCRNRSLKILNCEPCSYQHYAQM